MLALLACRLRLSVELVDVLQLALSHIPTPTAWIPDALPNMGCQAAIAHNCYAGDDGLIPELLGDRGVTPQKGGI